jgi:hypothetical protein
MAKKTKTEGNVAGEPLVLTEDDRAYGAAVVKKQCGLSEEAADKRAAELGDETLGKVVLLGRAGLVDQVRELLGLE